MINELNCWQHIYREIIRRETSDHQQGMGLGL